MPQERLKSPKAQSGKKPFRKEIMTGEGEERSFMEVTCFLENWVAPAVQRLVEGA
jgi:hypothetical protein